MHGAALRVPADATAFSRRDACFNVSALAIWDDASHDDEHVAWARRTAAVLRVALRHRRRLSQLRRVDEPIERVRAAYGDTTSSGCGD